MLADFPVIPSLGAGRAEEQYLAVVPSNRFIHISCIVRLGAVQTDLADCESNRFIHVSSTSGAISFGTLLFVALPKVYWMPN